MLGVKAKGFDEYSKRAIFDEFVKSRFSIFYEFIKDETL